MHPVMLRAFLDEFQKIAAVKTSLITRTEVPLGKGLAARKNKQETDFEPRELLRGAKHEMEHTDNPEIAKRIAMDHLTEDQKYYRKLSRLEKTSAVHRAIRTMRV